MMKAVGQGEPAMTRPRQTLLALYLLAASPAVHAESWVGLLAGNNGTVSDGTVTATQTQLICLTAPCSQTVAGQVRFNREHTTGIRGGIWYGTYGLAWEYTISGVTSAGGPGASPASVEVNFDSLSLLALARTPALQTEFFPDSYLYAGLGASSVYGRFSVLAPPLAPMSGTDSTAGLMILGGGVMRFSQHFMLFGEWRMQDLTFNYSEAGNSLNIPVRVSEFILGAAYWY
jgi:hypothetical protein